MIEYTQLDGSGAYRLFCFTSSDGVLGGHLVSFVPSTERQCTNININANTITNKVALKYYIINLWGVGLWSRIY